MKRPSEIAMQIRDSQIRSLHLSWVEQKKLKIKFLKGNKLIRLTLEDLIELDVFHFTLPSFIILCLAIWVSYHPIKDFIQSGFKVV